LANEPLVIVTPGTAGEIGGSRKQRVSCFLLDARGAGSGDEEAE